MRVVSDLPDGEIEIFFGQDWTDTKSADGTDLPVGQNQDCFAAGERWVTPR
jgi:hypothetical protein